MQSGTLLFCIALFFFSLRGEDDNRTGEENQPKWFRNFTQEYEAKDKKKSDKWCAMFQHLPQDVKKELIFKLTEEKKTLRTIFGIVIEVSTIETYATYAARLIYPQKTWLQNVLASLFKQPVKSFSDRFKEESFKIMVSELYTISRLWFYPGWHVQRCIKYIKNP